ncbi:hypothetical protein O59_000886 [Cellvibrio sp. BR]|nr:hypothetical protein O59_000886 [Cellvibrio sp. BR]
MAISTNKLKSLALIVYAIYIIEFTTCFRLNCNPARPVT